jgi:hypothetical protein
MFFYTVQYIIFIIVSGSETVNMIHVDPKSMSGVLEPTLDIKKACPKPNFHPP